MYLGILVLVLNVSNAPPLGQQTAEKSPRNPPPYPVLGVVGCDNDRRIICPRVLVSGMIAAGEKVLQLD